MITAKVWPVSSRSGRIKRTIRPYSIFQMNYGMKLEIFCPERNRLKQQAGQLYLSEKYLMVCPLHPKNRMSVEVAACSRVWLWFHMSQTVSGVGRVRHFQKVWIRLLKIYDDLMGIRWTWQSLDSISIKSPLGGRWQETIPLTEEANWAQKGIF